MGEKLSSHGEDQVTNYLRFGRVQRDTILKELDHVFVDFKESRVLENTYSAEEVRKMLEDLRLLARSSFSTELRGITNTVVVMLRSLLIQADKQYVTVDVDASMLDDQKLLEEVAKAEDAKFGKNAPALSAVKPQLASLATDPNAALQAGKVKEDMAQMRERLQKMQSQYTQVMKEKTSLVQDIEHLKEQVEVLKLSESEKGDKLKRWEDEASLLKTKHRELEIQIEKLSKPSNSPSSAAEDGDKAAYVLNLRKELNETKAKLDEVSKDSMGRLNESKQFLQLKKLLAQKNDQVKKLREELKVFKPDADVPSVDDD